MTYARDDTGLTTTQLVTAAWLLGLGALGSGGRLVVLAAHHHTPVQSSTFAWLAICVLAAAFSACSAVLAGLKAAEARLGKGLQALEMHDS